jgi:hypothetical protein
VKSVGSAVVNIRIGNVTFHVQVVLVYNLPWKLMLGNDFLKNKKCLIDYSTETVHIGSGYYRVVVSFHDE